MAYISVFHLIPAHIHLICVETRKEKLRSNLIQEGANEDQA